MPTADIREHLATLYAQADDPWDTHSSAYEHRKFAQTMASLPRARYLCGLEVGCGAGALTGRLASRCGTLCAMDCTAAALSAARTRNAATNIVFTEGTAPHDWPVQPPDLVMLSEVLYFLTDDESVGLARRLVHDCAPECDIVLVHWLGTTGGGIPGANAALRLLGLLTQTHDHLVCTSFRHFRIDVLRGRNRHDLTVP